MRAETVGESATTREPGLRAVGRSGACPLCVAKLVCWCRRRIGFQPVRSPTDRLEAYPTPDSPLDIPVLHLLPYPRNDDIKNFTERRFRPETEQASGLLDIGHAALHVVGVRWVTGVAEGHAWPNLGPDHLG